jgi:Rieske Fe-S protein
VRLELDGGLQVTADAGVLATNAPINDVIGYSSKVSSYMTYVIGARIPSGSVPPFIAFDTEDPYHYVRIQPAGDHDVLIVGGEDHRTGQGEELAAPFAALEEWTHKTFSMAGEVIYRWSGQVRNSLDGLALIGRDLVDEHIYIITGDTGMGMTHGTLGGMIITDLIGGRRNPWAELYDPARLPTQAAGGVVSELANTVSQLKEWVTGGDVSSEDEIPPNSGAVVGWGLGKAAVYRDPQGALHRYSALCSHTGCVIAWNDIEKTWDCPCHGSRYDAHGHVINGPAKHNLDPAE